MRSQMTEGAKGLGEKPRGAGGGDIGTWRTHSWRRFTAWRLHSTNT